MHIYGVNTTTESRDDIIRRDERGLLGCCGLLAHIKRVAVLSERNREPPQKYTACSRPPLSRDVCAFILGIAQFGFQVQKLGAELTINP